MLPDAPSGPTRLLLLLAVSLLLPGCHYLHLAAGHAELMRAREPIDRLLARPATAAPLRERLAYVREVLAFATGELGLPDNGSYRSYSDIGRPYVTWNVFAAGEFDVRGRRWCFLVAGCVSYRGYFDEAKARRFAARQAARGDDVWIGPALAYSTLGHFRDPVLNTMLAQDAAGLAALLFHELAHQAAWVTGDADFNEAFATVVEMAGARRWLAARGLAGEADAFERQHRNEALAAASYAAARARLAELYGSTLPPFDKRAARQREFDRLREELRSAGTSAGELNNARLVAASTYHRCVPGLEAQLIALGGDLPAFYAWAREQAKAPGRRAVICGD